MVEYIVVRCCNEKCDMFQVMQQKKVPKWSCKICNQKQSVRKVYGTSYKASDLRALVMDYNMKKGTLKEKPIEEDDNDELIENETNRLEAFHDRKYEDTFSDDPKQSKWGLFLDDEEKQETVEEEGVAFVFENKKLKKVDKKWKKRKETKPISNNNNDNNNYNNDYDDDDNNVRISEKAPSKTLVSKSKSFVQSKATYSEKRIVDGDDEDIDVTIKKKSKNDGISVYDKQSAFEPKPSYKSTSVDISKPKIQDHSASTSQHIKLKSRVTTKSSTEKPASSGKWAQWLDDEKENEEEESSESEG